MLLSNIKSNNLQKEIKQNIATFKELTYNFISKLSDNFCKNPKSLWKSISASRCKRMNYPLPRKLDNIPITSNKDLIDIFYTKFKDKIGKDPPTHSEKTTERKNRNSHNNIIN